MPIMRLALCSPYPKSLLNISFYCYLAKIVRRNGVCCGLEEWEDFMRRARSFQKDRGTWIHVQGYTSLGVINQSTGMWGANYLEKEEERLVEAIARKT